MSAMTTPPEGEAESLPVEMLAGRFRWALSFLIAGAGLLVFMLFWDEQPVRGLSGWLGVALIIVGLLRVPSKEQIGDSERDMIVLVGDSMNGAFKRVFLFALSWAVLIYGIDALRYGKEKTVDAYDAAEEVLAEALASDESEAEGDTPPAPKGTSSDSSALPEPSMTASIGMELRLIPAGSFVMGSSSGSAQEQPTHTVAISKPFYLGVTEVTQRQWVSVMSSNPSKFEGDDNPVDNVSWDQAQRFIRA